MLVGGQLIDPRMLWRYDGEGDSEAGVGPGCVDRQGLDIGAGSTLVIGNRKFELGTF